MSDSTSVRGHFSHTPRAKRWGPLHPFAVEKQREMARAAAFAPYLDELACGELSGRTRRAVRVSDLRTRARPVWLNRLRQRCWIILRWHPDADFSWPIIAGLYARDHTTVMACARDYLHQLEDGRHTDDLTGMQTICDGLARKGYRPWRVRDLIDGGYHAQK